MELAELFVGFGRLSAVETQNWIFCYNWLKAMSTKTQ
jgi:hypothetical protein